jgi:hypothetical protein
VASADPAPPNLVVPAPGKLRNGLYLEEVAVYDDRVSVHVFTSRPFRAGEFAALRLTDDVGTDYVMVARSEEVSEGHTVIEFRPPPPVRWSQLHFGEPGWGLHIVNQLE